jgi:hypothetical protein
MLNPVALQEFSLVFKTEYCVPDAAASEFSTM